MEEGQGSLGVTQQNATLQRSSSNQSRTPSQGGGSGTRTRARTGPSLTHRASIHALAMQTAGVGIRPGTGPSITIPQIAGAPNPSAPQNDWYEVGSIRSGHYSGGYAPSIGNPSMSARRRMMIPPQPPPKSNWSKFKDAFRSFVAWVFSNVGICVLVVGYLIIGAFTFQQIEGPEELKISYQVSEYRKQVVQKLWHITAKYNVLEYEKWKSESEEIVEQFQFHIVQEADNGYDGSDGHPNQWTFSGSLLYSITVITTIGKIFSFLMISFQICQMYIRLNFC